METEIANLLATLLDEDMATNDEPVVKGIDSTGFVRGSTFPIQLTDGRVFWVTVKEGTP